MKIVINSQHGGFGISRRAFERMRELGNPHALAEPDIGQRWSDGSIRSGEGLIESFGKDIPRDDSHLVQVVGELGDLAAAQLATLKIVDIPDDVEWQIEEFDGREWVAEKHRTWE